MKKCLIILIAVSFTFIGTANAEKPDWVSKKKAVKDDMKVQKKVMKAYSDDERGKKEKKEKEIKGLEKQREIKTAQIQKELDKGSAQGQEARQQRKKWWKFRESN
jgi:hypothetical protein